MLIRVSFTLYKVGWISFNKKNAKYIVWAPDFFTFKFFASDNFQNVLFSYFHLILEGKISTVYVKKDIGRFDNKHIIYFGSDSYNTFGFYNYINSLINISENLELQNNKVYPSSHEVKFWENKGFMHEYFEDISIRSPKTIVRNTDVFAPEDITDYPILLKDEHSCSGKGVHKISCESDLKTLVYDERFLLLNNKIVIQDLLNIRRDLRVILVGKEIVLFYWRINLSDEWKPTSTGYGSKVDFGNFPEQWRSWIVDSFDKLGFVTGAFDVAWDNDDLNSEPYILEVSPFYQPNPIPNNQKDLVNYGNWKKSSRFLNSYQVAMVKIMFEIRGKFIKELLKHE
jgi:hypothetical protein